MLRQPEATKRAAIVMLTSNRGLAGAFNANLIKETRTLIRKLEGDGATVDLHVVGRKGLGYFKYLGREVATSRTDLGDRPSAADAAALVNKVMDDFASGPFRGRGSGVELLRRDLHQRVGNHAITILVLGDQLFAFLMFHR